MLSLETKRLRRHLFCKLFAPNPCRAMTEALHIVCPHCHTTNRVQSADLGNAPDCGQCHRPLFAGAPLVS